VLPQLAIADAKTVRDMTDPTMKSTINAATIMTALENNYARIGITAAQVGTFDPDGSCVTGSSGANSLATSAVAILMAAVVAILSVSRQ